MIYTRFGDAEISRLGLGAMRLPVTADGAIDRSAAKEIVDYAYAHGVNYFDTAYMYHEGESERFLGEALANYDRSSFYLADKFPGWLLEAGQSPETIFEEQLERCATDYFDFYLFHNLNERVIDTYLDARFLDYFQKQKEAGRIRHLGFSAHALPETLERFVAARDWDFGQLQLNYLDWALRDAERQYSILADAEVPVWVMEPVRGGRLASLSPEADALLQAAQPGRSVASWAFRWLMSLENVRVVLSGMTTLEQLRDNLATFEREDPLDDALKTTLDDAVELLRDQLGVPCTACGYCLESCPQGLDIPDLLNIYNNLSVSSDFVTRKRLACLDPDGRPETCIACGACMDACPQRIDIPGTLAALAEMGSAPADD